MQTINVSVEFIDEKLDYDVYLNGLPIESYSIKDLNNIKTDLENSYALTAKNEIRDAIHYIQDEIIVRKRNAAIKNEKFLGNIYYAASSTKNTIIGNMIHACKLS